MIYHVLPLGTEEKRKKHLRRSPRVFFAKVLFRNDIYAQFFLHQIGHSDTNKTEYNVALVLFRIFSYVISTKYSVIGHHIKRLKYVVLHNYELR